MSWAERARGVMHSLVRRRTRVVFDDLARTTPISTRFGLERGTPIDRYYIATFLGRHRAAISGRVLEIGEARYTRAFGSAVTHSEVLHVEARDNVTIVGDLTRLATLPAGTIDCAICTQTLNFIYDVDAAVTGLRHVLRPGGTALVTAAGISQISRYDMARWGDYWRFTDASLRRLFEPKFTSIELECYGNVAAAVAFLQGVAVEDLPDRCALDAHDGDYQVTLGVVARV